MAKWHPFEVNRLRGYFRNTPAKLRDPTKLAKELCRTTESVICKANSMGFCFSDFDEEEDERITAYYTQTPDGEFNLKKFAELLGRDYTAVSKRAGILGLTKQGRSRGGKDGGGTGETVPGEEDLS